MNLAVILLIAALPLAGQPRRLLDAQLHTLAASGNFEKQVEALRTTQPQPAWIAYIAAAAGRPYSGCEGTVHLEPPRELMILLRIHNNQISQIRTLSPDCEISAGGVPFYWFTGVEASASVALLAAQVKSGNRLADAAAGAIGAQGGPAAETALEAFLSTGTSSIRHIALRALSRRGGPRALAAIRRTVESGDSLRRQAISALRTLPDGEGIPALIEMAKSHRDTEVRKQAMTALGQSHDPRAISYFEEVLRSR